MYFQCQVSSIKMADQGSDHDEDEVPGYKAPEQKALTDIVNQDQEDESLRKYKEQLLGSALQEKIVVCELIKTKSNVV